MVADERFANPTGIVQGGFLAAFADSAMGASSLTYARERKVFSANAELKVSFLKPARVGSVPDVHRAGASRAGSGPRSSRPRWSTTRAAWC